MAGHHAKAFAEHLHAGAVFDDGVEPKAASEADVAAFHAARRNACPQA